MNPTDGNENNILGVNQNKPSLFKRHWSLVSFETNPALLPELFEYPKHRASTSAFQTF